MPLKKTATVALAAVAAGVLLSTTASAFANTPAAAPGVAASGTTEASTLPRGYQIVTLPNKNVPNFKRRTVWCPPHKHVIGGGAEAQGPEAVLVGSFPTSDGRGWIALGRQTNRDDVGISVYAICAY
ncbi:hypothetical protein HNP84_001059 [Thermocatellispora tengchongensis]|uniref:Secreted protein n=1 Tax=Thermocatellispora tengchongensis TaxID=1073253 RepID=A0A840P090_9ACTN|nr:hypothetical protein [Thermocatellispora tengchongensis]MBB5131353.1 hypothetical protein [Thermocatellispora tengchongensis]